MPSRLVSKRKYALFLYSAWVVVCMGLLIGFMLTPIFHQIDVGAKRYIFMQILGGVLGFVGVPASIIIFFGMASFCIREDVSPIGIKVLWFIFFFATAWFGAAVYFFTVYKKQVTVTAISNSD